MEAAGFSSTVFLVPKPRKKARHLCLALGGHCDGPELKFFPNSLFLEKPNHEETVLGVLEGQGEESQGPQSQERAAPQVPRGVSSLGSDSLNPRKGWPWHP